MQDLMQFPSDEWGRAARKVAFALVDADLMFTTDSVDIRTWVRAGGETLVGSQISEIIPEVMGHEYQLQQLLYDPEDCYTLSGLHRRTERKFDFYFDLQIMAAEASADALVVSVIDVTQHTLMSHRLQEIKSVPALKMTPEEIRQSLDSLERWNNALFLLNQAGQVLTATLNMQQVLEHLLQVTIELVRAEGSSVWLWDDSEPDYLVCQAVFHKMRPPVEAGQRLHAGQGLAGWVAASGRSASIIRAAEDSRFSAGADALGDTDTESLLVIPLRIRDETVGVLEVVNKQDGDFDADDLAVSETLAAYASIAIENARLVEALQLQTEDLRARNEELDAFAHTVAHDLQNPLSQISGFATLLRSDESRLSKDDRELALQVVANNAQKMSTIIRELLLLASVRKTEVEMCALHMDQIVKSAMERLAHLIVQNDAQIVLPDQWPAAVGHAPWIEEIWENYLSNALKYGGQSPRVELGGEVQPGGMVRFWVQDDGPGLSDDDQTRLFAPFTKLSVNGHGLGLSIVQRIAHKLGGQVSVESAPGDGSTFSFTLHGVDAAE